ncbi:MAG TPA: TolC family protein, partial [Aquabacterium sp.]|nr:TolC family protein [Aquabacterium sp.]
AASERSTFLGRTCFEAQNSCHTWPHAVEFPIRRAILGLMRLNFLSVSFLLSSSSFFARLQQAATAHAFARSRVMTLVAFSALLACAGAGAQTLDELRAAARNNHPAIKSARLGVDAAGKEVDAASARYLPSLSIVLEGGGKDLVAEPSRYLRLEQNVWDGGATAAGVDLAKQSAELARSRVPEQEQDIDLQVISAWQTLQSANGRVVVADRLLKLLSDHEAMMTRRVQSELSTQVELQLVQAQVMQAGLDRRKALLNASLAKLRLEQLTGIEGLRNTLSSPASEGVPERFAAEAQAFQGTDWAALANRQPTVRRAEKELLAAQSRIETKRSELRPQLYARVDRGLGSGGTTAAFVGVRYSTGAGFAASSEVDALIARAASLEGARDAARLEALQAMLNDADEIQENLQRSKSLVVSVESSRQIHESYVRQFTAAKKSWLDVMNAMRELSQNEYALNDVQHNFFGLLKRLRVYAAQQP